MIPAVAELDPPIECVVDYFDEPNVTVPVAGWDPSWLYVIEQRIKGYPSVVCMVAWENVVGLRRAETLL